MGIEGKILHSFSILLLPTGRTSDCVEAERRKPPDFRRKETREGKSGRVPLSSPFPFFFLLLYAGLLLSLFAKEILDGAPRSLAELMLLTAEARDKSAGFKTFRGGGGGGGCCGGGGSSGSSGPSVNMTSQQCVMSFPSPFKRIPHEDGLPASNAFFTYSIRGPRIKVLREESSKCLTFLCTRCFLFFTVKLL